MLTNKINKALIDKLIFKKIEKIIKLIDRRSSS